MCRLKSADLEVNVSRLRLREQLANARGNTKANSEVTVPNTRLCSGRSCFIIVEKVACYR